MFLSSLAPMRQLVADVLVVAAMLCTLSSAFAQAEEETPKAPVGRLNFEAADLPEANVEVDLSQDMFRDLFGIGDAAIAGVAEALLNSPKTGDGAQAMSVAAEQAEALRQIIQLAGNVVHEVHVRVYENMSEDSTGDFMTRYKPFEEQLSAGNWETLARVRKEDEMVRVAAIRDSGALRGLFVVATDGNGLVLANVVCDVSPENVKLLMSAATKIGLENGLAREIEIKFRRQMDAIGADRAPRAEPDAPPRSPETPKK
jgi:hypothetical protein